MNNSLFISNLCNALSLPTDFFEYNKVEILWDNSQQYLCYINYKEGDGAYGLGMTFEEALINGLRKYNNET